MAKSVAQLSAAEEVLHQTALRLCREHRRIEWRIVDVLQKLDRRKTYRKFAATSLFKYAVDHLKLSESVAYGFISIARKAVEVPALSEAIRTEKLTAAKATRIVGALTPTNSEALIQFAIEHSTRETDAEVARINPRLARPDQATPICEELTEVRLTARHEVVAKLKRCQDLLAQKIGRHADLGETLEALVDLYISKHDPVAKAQRAQARKPAQSESNGELCAHRVPTESGRTPLTAEQRHSVHQRDQGKCTFVDSAGRPCQNERWIHIHHIEPASEGGSNDVENLTTLCAAHHDLVHQLSLDIEKSDQLVRETIRRYGPTVNPQPIRP